MTTSEDEAFEEEVCSCAALACQSSSAQTDAVPGPLDVMVQSITTTSAVVIWVPPEGIDHFEISYSTQGEVTRTTSSNNSVEVEKLHPGTEYTFSVASILNERRSLPITATAYTNPVPPRRFKVGHVTAEAVKLTWESPEFAIRQYRVTCHEGDKLIEEKETGFVSAEFTGLLPSVRYTFAITAILHNGMESKKEVRHTQTKSTLDGVLVDLSLEKYFKEKLSLSTVLQIRKTTISDEPPRSLSSLPWCFLKRLMMVNVMARSVKCTVDPVEVSLDSGDLYNDLDSLVEYQESSQSINPLDIIVALFLCSDGFLQQEMALKMSMCQFSVPLLLPCSDTHQPMFMLWALRDIVKKFRPHSLVALKGFVEERIVLSKLPMVSFVRLGKCSLSKSQILNKLLSNPQQYHDTFLHYDMDCGDIPRKISDGLVEISWYLPCGQKNIDIFPEPVAVANLRGDISLFEAQYSFLCHVSAAVFVFFDSLDSGHKILTTQHHNAQLFLVANAQAKDFNMAAMKTVVSELNLKRSNVILKVKQMNDADFVKNIRYNLTDLLKKDPCKMQLEKMAEIAHELGISVDEDNIECQKAKQNAFGITSNINDTLAFKESHLPLQGKIWKDLAKLEKEECRLRQMGDNDIETYKSDLQMQKRELRERQQRHDISEAMSCFISGVSASRQETSYFMKWMRMNLDNLTQKSLTELRDLYKEKCQQSCVNKEEIKELDRQISNSSLGIEHFVREMGQLYESALAVPKGRMFREQLMHLPKLSAKLLLDGFPLELVDGDASNIPLDWVRDVLMELDCLVQPRNKILVATVLGVQSTGKSTLLNTMFGVQFAVSSGRCTRGAFMLLLKVNEDFPNSMNCDYLVIIDTEGLKSPELAQLDDSHEHDNELATLVIGLSDVTIINIAMENSTEMKDILQIVVHAFLRMKEVGKKPVCHFVHQNVADVSAHDKNLRDRKLLLEQLDEMTKAAAKMEGKEENQKFTDVMEYDPERGNWYIPGLWHGNPPMAPVNAGYSEAVYEFKKSLIQLLINDGVGNNNIQDFLEWTKSLWNAVKYENFIFSFRNSLVADAYRQLCAEYHKWEWEFKKHMYTWLMGAETQISNFGVTRPDEDKSTLNDLLCQLKTNAVQEVSQREKIILDNLTEYFKHTEGHAYLVERYREEFGNSAKCLCRESRNDVLNKLETKVSICKSKDELLNIQNSYINVMEKKVQLLLEKRNTSATKKTDKELEKTFEIMWKETLNELQLRGLEPKNVISNIHNHLRTNMIQRGGSLMEVIGNSKLQDCGKGSFHIEPPKGMKQKVITFFKQIFNNDQTIQAQEMADTLIKQCTELISKTSRQNSDYYDNNTLEVLQLIDQTLWDNSSLGTNEMFEVTLKLHICGIAAREFQEMHNRFIHLNDPLCCLERYRNTYLTAFKDLYNERDQCKTTAEEFTRLCLIPAVETWVADHLGLDIVDEMLVGKKSLQFSARTFFQYSLLKELLIKWNFQHYVECIGNYEDYVKNWIRDQIEEHFSSGQKMSQLEEKYLKSISNEISVAIQSALKQTDSEATIKSLILNICRELRGKLVMATSTLEATTAFTDVKVAPFAQQLLQLIPDIQKSLKEKFQQLDTQARLQTLKVKPQDELFKRVFGCGKLCPFCKAPCERGGDDHTEHFASIHRPQGLGRYRFDNSNKLVTDICSSSVHSDDSFRCFQTGLQWHPFKRYREIFPDWHIPADPSIQASDYWKYVMAKFNTRFADEYDAIAGCIPIGWKLITKEQAENSLKESFNVK